jgi:diguanylate cyclase (GGDEF)-like protein/PAS domain S-box-containing protein
MSLNFEDLIENLHDAVYFVDKDRTITYWNKAAELLTGFTAEEVVGSRCLDHILNHVDANGKNLCKDGCPLLESIRTGALHEAEVFLHHKTGHRVPVRVRVTPLRDEDGNIVGAAEMFVDNSQAYVLQKRLGELQELALHDGLTKISNRNHLQSELEIRFHERNRYGLDFGVLFMDLDNFKQVNDTYGHAVGDQVLKMAATTLSSTARPFDLFGRWGGEEFLGIIRNVGLDSLVTIGERCRVLIEKSYIPVGDEFLNITVSIGATVPRAGDTMDSMLKRVDGLLYQSKNKGRNCLSAG